MEPFKDDAITALEQRQQAGIQLSSESTDPISRPIYAVICAALCLLTFAAYAGSLDNGFLFWDDDVHVTANTFIRSIDWESLRWMFTTVHANNWHPLVWLSHATDYALFGLAPWGHHLTSVLFHCLNTLWVFALGLALLALISTPAREQDRPLRITRPILVAAAAAALLFGVHPQHVESVEWIAERKDVMFLFFLLPSFLAYLFYVRARSRPRRRGWYVTSLLCFALSIASKSMGVTTPVVLLLLDVYPLKRTALTPHGRQQKPGLQAHRGIILEKLPFLAVAVAASLLAVTAQGEGVAALAQIRPSFRLLNSFNSIVVYLRKWMLPIDLSPYYPYPTDYRGFFVNFHEYLPAIVVVFLLTTACAYLWFRGRHLWLTLWTFYLITLTPVIGIIAVGSQTSADRYAYLPTIPLYYVAGFCVSKLLCSEPARAAIRWGTAIAFTLVVLILIHLTRQQVAVWKNDLTFWQSVAAHKSNHYVAQAGLERAYRESSQHQKAIEHAKAALELDSESMTARLGLAESLTELGRLEEATAALAPIEDVLRKHQRASFHIRIAREHCNHGQPDKARVVLRTALQINAMSSKARRLSDDLKAGRCQ